MTFGSSLLAHDRWSGGFFRSALVTAIAFGVFATSYAAEREAAPDGAPTLTRETTITEKTQSTSSEGDELKGVIASESRVQGQLANARVSVGGRASYLVIDPAVGRSDRAASNGRRRVSPSQWELLRF